MKIRILNGGHAIIAYPAGLLDIHFVHEGMADPLVRAFLQKVETEEILPILPPVPGTDLADYFALIVRRCDNPKIGDTIRRLCLDGSNRQPKFIIPSIADRLDRGLPVDGLALESALWCRYCVGTTDSGQVIEPNDPNWDRLQAQARAAKADPAAWLAMRDIYGARRRRPRLPRRLRRLARARSGPTAPPPRCAATSPEAGDRPARPRHLRLRRRARRQRADRAAPAARDPRRGRPPPRPRRGARPLPRPLARLDPRDPRPRTTASPLTDAALAEMRHRLYAAFRAELRPIPGIAATLDALPCAYCVASSSQPERIELSLTVTGLWPRFEGRAFSATMVARGKPAPDLFLHAAEASATLRAACLVVEDSPAGIAAAKAAGMRVVAFTGGSHATTDAHRAAIAALAPDAVIDDIRALVSLCRAG